MRAFGLTFALLFAMPLLVGADARAHAEGEHVEADELYHEYCSVCHGDNGDGRSRARYGLKPPPRDFTEPGLLDTMGRDRMIQAVLYGSPGTAMAAWRTRLTREEATRIVDYIRENFMRGGSGGHEDHAGHDHGGHDEAGGHDHSAHLAAPSAVVGAPFPHGLVGDPGLGEELYRRSCVPCHGRDGKGEGPRASFILPRPRDFTSGPPISRPDLFHGIADGVRGREMPAWNKVLTDQQIANVAEYVFQEYQLPRLEDVAPGWQPGAGEQPMRMEAPAQEASAEHDHSSHAH